MKTIYIMRHGKAEMPKRSVQDFDRKLTDRGRRECQESAGKIKNAELIVASSAARTEETAEIIAEALGYDLDAIYLHDGLYNAPKEKWLQIIEATDDDIQDLVLVGHNPGMSDLAEHLSGDAGLFLGTAHVAVCRADIQSWSESSRGLFDLDI